MVKKNLWVSKQNSRYGTFTEICCFFLFSYTNFVMIFSSKNDKNLFVWVIFDAESNGDIE
jgi:hypothetical protein